MEFRRQHRVVDLRARRSSRRACAIYRVGITVVRGCPYGPGTAIARGAGFAGSQVPTPSRAVESCAPSTANRRQEARQLEARPAPRAGMASPSMPDHSMTICTARPSLAPSAAIEVFSQGAAGVPHAEPHETAWSGLGDPASLAWHRQPWIPSRADMEGTCSADPGGTSLADRSPASCWPLLALVRSECSRESLASTVLSAGVYCCATLWLTAVAHWGGPLRSSLCAITIWPRWRSPVCGPVPKASSTRLYFRRHELTSTLSHTSQLSWGIAAQAADDAPPPVLVDRGFRSDP